jgi:ferredoxin-NADP reductase/CRP-like cAMP-binding protein
MKLVGKRSVPAGGHDGGTPEEQLLRSTGLFSGLDPVQLRDMTKRLMWVSVPGGARIVEEGDPGNAVYVISSGEVRITTRDVNQDEIVLARLEPGQYFGEQALFDEIPSRRNASATAITDTDLLRLDQADFHHLLESSARLDQTLRERGARQLVDKWTRQRPAFASLDSKLLESLSRNVRHFHAGEVIFSQGDPADGVHFVADGEVRIVIDTPGDEARDRTVAPGQMFGEQGALWTGRRAGTAIAVTEVRTLFFDKKQFRRLYDTRPDVAGLVRDAQAIYEIPQRGVVSVLDSEYLGEKCLTSVFRLEDGRSVSASKVRGSEIFVLAEADAPEGRVLRWHKDLQRRELTLSDGRITAIVCHGYWPDLGRACAMALDGTRIDEWREVLFRDAGRLELVEPVADNDPNALLCNCMRVARGRVREVIRGGSTDVDAVSAATGAGTVCGICRPKISAMLGNTSWQPVRVVERVDRGPGVRSYRLAPYAGAVEPYEVGQHVVIQALIDERFISRTYTLTSHPAADSYEITVKRESQGYFSGWLFERAGDDPFLRVAPPSGTGVHTLLGDTPIVCLVAGIGVTPAVALARHLDHMGASQRLHVDYSAHTREDLAFADELSEIAGRRPNVTVHVRLTSETGRLGPGDVEDLVAAHPGAEFFVCGPRSYHADVTEALSAGVEPERVHSEEFRHAAAVVAT